MSRSEVFAQVVSDVLGLPVEVGATRESTALGAALCAGVAAGVFADLAEGAQTFRSQARTLQPDASGHARTTSCMAAGNSCARPAPPPTRWRRNSFSRRRSRR